MHRLKNSIIGKFMGDSLTLWLANMAGVLVTVVATIFVTRALGPEGRGVYTWLMTLSGIGTHLALFGLDTSNRRLAAAEPDKIPALLKLNFRLILGLGTVLALILSVVALTTDIMAADTTMVALAMFTIPLNAMTMAQISLFVATQKVSRASWASFLPKLLLSVSFASILLLGMVDVTWALTVNALAAVFGTALTLWWLRGYFGQTDDLPFTPYLKTVWRTCSATYLAGLAYYLMQKVDVLMIGYYMGEAPTGFYGVASNLVDLMIMPITIIAWMLASRIAAAHREGTATRLTRQVTAFTMALTIAGCAFTYAIAPWLIRMLFGEAFAPAAGVLRLLCPAVVGLAFFMLMHNILSATGRARYLALPALTGCIVNIILNMVLIPAYGLTGACIASIIAYPLAGFVGLWIIRKG